MVFYRLTKNFKYICYYLFGLQLSSSSGYFRRFELKTNSKETSKTILVIETGFRYDLMINRRDSDKNRG